MSDRMLASRYAEAVFWAAEGPGEVERVGQELNELGRIMRSTLKLYELLSHPGISLDRRMAGVHKVLADSPSATVVSLLRLLLKGQRIELLPAIAEHYQELVDRWHGITPGEVTTVIPLTDEQRVRLETALNRMVSGRVVLQNRIDPEILGGAVVRLSDRIIDGSVRNRLVRLRANLTQAEGSHNAD